MEETQAEEDRKKNPHRSEADRKRCMALQVPCTLPLGWGDYKRELKKEIDVECL